MIGYNEEEINLCVNCDAEFTVKRIDDEDDVELCFCPFCGYEINSEDDFNDEDDEYN